MYCKYCGKELPEGASFCPNCGPGGKRVILRDMDPMTPEEYFAAHGTPAAKKRIKMLWIIVVLSAVVPVLLLFAAIIAVHVLKPTSQITAGAWLAPLTITLPSLLLGAMACMKKTQGWAVAYLVVTIFFSPMCLLGPILVLILKKPLDKEYAAYLQRTGNGK